VLENLRLCMEWVHLAHSRSFGGFMWIQWCTAVFHKFQYISCLVSASSHK